MEDYTDVNVLYVKELDRRVQDAIKETLETEETKYIELHGKNYKGLIFQHQKKRDREDRLRIYAGDKAKKRYYSVPRYTPVEKIFELCDSILGGER